MSITGSDFLQRYNTSDAWYEFGPAVSLDESGLRLDGGNPNHAFVRDLQQVRDEDFAAVLREIHPDALIAYLYNRYPALFRRWDNGHGGGRAMDGRIEWGEIGPFLHMLMRDLHTEIQDPRDRRIAQHLYVTCAPGHRDPRRQVGRAMRLLQSPPNVGLNAALNPPARQARGGNFAPLASMLSREGMSERFAEALGQASDADFRGIVRRLSREQVAEYLERRYPGVLQEIRERSEGAERRGIIGTLNRPILDAAMQVIEGRMHDARDRMLLRLVPLGRHGDLIAAHLRDAALLPAE